MNEIKLSGKVSEEPKLTHEICGEKFYKFYIEVDRLSNRKDVLPCNISETIVEKVKGGENITVIGKIRTRNIDHQKLDVFVFVTDVQEFEGANNNFAVIDGYICKEPSYRITPMGREITDFILAHNRKTFRRSDYIPSIAWGRNALRVSYAELGDELRVSGRFQSREYIKKFEDGTQEKRVAYELSVVKVEFIKESEDEQDGCEN